MLEIALHSPRQHSQFVHTQGPLLLARLESGGSVWTAVDEAKAGSVSAFLRIAPDADGVVMLAEGCEAESCFRHSIECTPGCRLTVPTTFRIGDTCFEIFDTSRLAALDNRPLQKLHPNDDRRDLQSESGPSSATVSHWFAAIGSLNRWGTSLQELYAQAVRCAVEAIGLDGAVLLRRRDNRWEIAASHLPRPELGIHCDSRVLDELLGTPQTMFHGSWRTEKPSPAGVRSSAADGARDPARNNPTSPVPSEGRNPQCTDPPAVVISPLRNAAGQLVGAIYGYRSVRSGNNRRAIRYLEAQTVELLANAVSEGIARLEHEAEVDRRRVLLEQALAGSHDDSSRRLSRDEREVTLLFADLRRSTQLIAALEMAAAYQLLGDVMDCLTAAVMDHDGLVIDYYGDGLAAMWNAPADQAEHPELACRAALRMLDTLQDVAADWADILSAGLQLAIGVHTGKTIVGNAGSRRRSKYGPRGPSVHQTSRVEAASKELQVPLVVTHSTAERLSNRFTTHRLCRARLRGTERPVDLYAISTPTANEAQRADWATYDTALRLFEEGNLTEAASTLQVLNKMSSTAPVRFLAFEIERAFGRQRRRRSTDGHAPDNGIVTLGGR